MGTRHRSHSPSSEPAADTASAPADGPSEIGLEQLAEQSGVSTRTIRYYQSEGVLPRPRKEGRDARYSATHVERLELISELQARGLKLEAIKELVGRDRQHRTVSDWLGVDEVLRASWADDETTTMTLAEIHALLAKHPRRLVGEMVDAGLLSRHDDGTFVVPSRAMLDLTLRMLDAGVSIDIGTQAATILRRRLSKAADDLVRLFESETGKSFAGKGRPAEIATALDALRPIAQDAAQLVLSQELERALRTLATKGRTSKRS
ncbi:MAG: MerR family transcriptional regulator [Acidimicrobiia bacterium]